MKNISHGILFEPDGGEGGDGGTGDGGGEGDGDGDGTNDDPPTPEEALALREENARLKAQAAKGRTEAARAAKALKDAERKKAEEDGNLTSELQKRLDEAEKRSADAEAKLQKTMARGIAKELGAIDAGDTVALLDWDAVVDPTDESEVRQAIRALLKSKPHLRAVTKDPDAGKSGGSGGKAGDGTDINSILRRAAGHRD